MRNVLFCVLVLASACKKDEKAAPAADPKPEAAKPTEVAPTEAKPAVAAAPAAGGVKLVAGEAKFGCLAYAESNKTAACITGESGSTEKEFSLEILGGAAAVKVTLAEKIDDAMVAQGKDIGGDYVAFTAPATKLEHDKAADLGGGASLKHTVKVKDPGGPNVAPTEEHKVLAICGGKETVVWEVAEEGRQLEVAYRKVSAGALVEITTHLGREGEFASGFEAKIVDPACKVL